MQLQQLFFPILIFAVFWLLLIRPQQQRQKAQRELLGALKVGDEVVTIGGIYGTVVELSEKRVRISVYDGSELEVARQAIGSVVPASGEDGTQDGTAPLPGEITEEPREIGEGGSSDE